MILELSDSEGTLRNVKSRPKFHSFASMSKSVLASLQKTKAEDLVPVSCILEKDVSDADHDAHSSWAGPSKQIPIGINLGANSIECSDLSNLHVSKATESLEKVDKPKTLRIATACFPLLAQVLNAWIDDLKEGGQPLEKTEVCVFLVTGAGKARNRKLR